MYFCHRNEGEIHYETRHQIRNETRNEPKNIIRNEVTQDMVSGKNLHELEKQLDIHRNRIQKQEEVEKELRETVDTLMTDRKLLEERMELSLKELEETREECSLIEDRYFY